MEGGSKPRFGDVSDETLLQTITEAGNENTARATSTWLRVVSDYRSEKARRLPSHVVVLKNWQRSSKNSLRK